MTIDVSAILKGKSVTRASIGPPQTLHLMYGTRRLQEVRYTVGMEVSLPPDLTARLDRIAEQQGRDSAALVHEAVERFVRYDEWLVREVERGLAAADRGELIDHEEIGKLIDSRYPG